MQIQQEPVRSHYLKKKNSRKKATILEKEVFVDRFLFHATRRKIRQKRCHLLVFLVVQEVQSHLEFLGDPVVHSYGNTKTEVTNFDKTNNLEIVIKIFFCFV